ncbi:hypothetical protein [Geminocystis herdmanii]|uniref:hypothetical protein n=1 Tax=Geminocystis herdmanii TaxID=669359 RepID=UPI00034C4BEE|nr:hypothetical protein [Geminocystis herdmanii]
MRRRSKSNKVELELFPFLSVLACTIGSLILLIIVVSTETLNDNPEVTIIAKSEGGFNQKKQPRYIECKEDGIVIYPSQEFVSKNEMNKPNSKLAKFIKEIKQNKDKEYIIVAVRPSGIEVFDTLRDIIMKEEIDIGYEPIEEDWILKFE